MRLFPTHHQTMHTPRSLPEVRERLCAHTLTKIPASPFFCKPNGFWGTVNSRDFKINLIGEGYRNSFTPRIWGIMEEDETGTTLHLSMTLSPLTKFILRFYLCTCLFVLLMGVAKYLIHHQFIWQLFTITVLMVIFALVLTHFCFRIGCKYSLKSLTDIL